jgi:hypothetical protein
LRAQSHGAKLLVRGAESQATGKGNSQKGSLARSKPNPLQGHDSQATDKSKTGKSRRRKVMGLKQIH